MQKPIPFYAFLAQQLEQLERQNQLGNQEWIERLERRIRQASRNALPSGSGFDSGTKLDLDLHFNESGKLITKNIILNTGFHHMNPNGFYDGWTEHKVTIKPSLSFGFELVISGRNRNYIKDYIHEQFDYLLRLPVKLQSSDSIPKSDWLYVIGEDGESSYLCEWE